MKTTQAYGMRRTVVMPYSIAVEKTKAALQQHGFGLVSEIDMREKLKEKLGVDFKRYIILGACNPPLAHKALLAEPEIGLLLPCNVIVYERTPETSVISAIDPDSMIGLVGDNVEVAEVAKDAKWRLQKALEAIG